MSHQGSKHFTLEVQSVLSRSFYGAIMTALLVFNTGCASIGTAWKNFITGKSDQETQEKARSRSTKYSDQQNLVPNTYRKYKRTKRTDLENEAQLDSKAGSLWVMEGQGAYLFSQNIVRMIGDPISVRIEGDPADQLSSKAGVINKLLAQIEDRRRRASGRGLASANGEKAKGQKTDAAAVQEPQVPGQQPAPTAPLVPNAATGAPEEKSNFNVKMVPTRVVERLVDGNYRVRGTQPVMIGTREYKVIVSGIVRAEDFNEDGISAGQLLDSSFDIVSSKGAELR